MPPASAVQRKLRVLGVPEHFNHPIQDAIKSGEFAAAGIQLDFTPCPGGTGAMLAAVLSGEADIAVALTEGIVATVVKQYLSSSSAATVDGSQYSEPQLRYCGEYVTSPLRWMIVTGAARGIHDLADVRNLLSSTDGATDGSRRATIRVSVSRLGSGSHLMAVLLAAREGWPTDALEFVVHRDFRSMRRAVVEGDADLFMWEWYMTLPFAQAGELGVLSYIDTPWACFGFTARADWLNHTEHRVLLEDASAVIFRAAARFVREEDESAEAISAHYGLTLDDAHAWLGGVRYAGTLGARYRMLEDVVTVLAGVGILPASIGDADAAGISIQRDVIDARLCKSLTSSGISEDVGVSAGLPARVLHPATGPAALESIRSILLQATPHAADATASVQAVATDESTAGPRVSTAEHEVQLTVALELAPSVMQEMQRGAGTRDSPSRSNAAVAASTSPARTRSATDVNVSEGYFSPVSSGHRSRQRSRSRSSSRGGTDQITAAVGDTSSQRDNGIVARSTTATVAGAGVTSSLLTAPSRLPHSSHMSQAPFVFGALSQLLGPQRGGERASSPAAPVAATAAQERKAAALAAVAAHLARYGGAAASSGTGAGRPPPATGVAMRDAMTGAVPLAVAADAAAVPTRVPTTAAGSDVGVRGGIPARPPPRNTDAMPAAAVSSSVASAAPRLASSSLHRRLRGWDGSLFDIG